ncbi:MAG: hypothetical protein ABJB74_21200 [Gemmatimonas sp.]
MQHLETERIAAFDHDEPSAEELAHLAACTVCRTERNAFSALNQRSMQMAADAPAFSAAPRLTNWESLSTRLRAEGLIAGDAPPEVTRFSDAEVASNEVRFENVMRALNKPTFVDRNENELQAVAMDSWWQRAKPRSNSEFFRAVAAVLFFAISGAGLNQIRNNRSGSAGEPTSITSASIGIPDFSNTGFTSVDQATKALVNIEREFDRASTYITANDPSATKTDILRKRLAALDRVIAATHAEWINAPQDRVLEHHYNSAYAARELTLKQLGGALPVGRSLERF